MACTCVCVCVCACCPLHKVPCVGVYVQLCLCCVCYCYCSGVLHGTTLTLYQSSGEDAEADESAPVVLTTGRGL